MKIKHLELKELKIPFRVSFKHTSAKRDVTETVIAIAQVDEVTGYGEGCPRSYVTGESVESCFDFMARHQQNILKINSIESLRKFVSANQSFIDKNPSAWCAIETAILDLFGKLEGRSIETLLGIPEIQNSFHYTAVLGVSDPKVFSAQLEQYLQLGFTDFKLKILGDVKMDTANISAISNFRIRLDANNLWTDANEASTYLANLPQNFWAVEEAIKVGDYAGIKKLADNLDYKIILDESFLRLEDITNLQWIPNIRISKMGGLLRSLAIAEECRKLGIKFILGAQVGETSILTRVAISLANAYRDRLIAQEGAFGTHLLERDITDLPIMFGKGGVVNLRTKNTNGLGLD